jgi:hypothetical protein
VQGHPGGRRGNAVWQKRSIILAELVVEPLQRTPQKATGNTFKGNRLVGEGFIVFCKKTGNYQEVK